MSDLAFEHLRRELGQEYLNSASSIDKPLTDEEKRAVLERIDHGVTEPVQQRQFANAADFNKAGPSNFYTHFVSEEQGVLLGNIKRSRRVFQRFEILYPEMAKRMVGAHDSTDSTLAHTEELFIAYILMSELVDANDANVIDNGEVDELYLMR